MEIEIVKNGFKTRHVDGLKDIYLKSEHEVQITACITYLTEFYEPAKTYPYRTPGSYGMKHKIEDHVGFYICNGACIEAAKRLGIEFKQDGFNSPNAVFKLKKRKST